MEHHRRLEQAYARAPITIAQQAQVRVGDGEAVVIIPVQHSFLHAAKAVHGSIVFRALDDAAFFAANSIVPDALVLTVTFNVTYFRPISGGRITARGRIRNSSRRLLVATSEAFDDDEKLIAIGTGTFMRSEIRLDADIGY